MSSVSPEPVAQPTSEPGKDRKVLLAEAARLAAHYLDEMETRGAFPGADALAGLAAFDEPLPSHPQAALETLALLDSAGSPATVASASGRYFGFVTGGTLPAALGAGVLSAAWDQNATSAVGSPVAARLEGVALGWLVELLGLPAGTGGGFVSGATMANFSGLAAARHALLHAAGWDAEAQGLFGAPPITVIVGNEVHVSLLKALSLAGFGRERVVRVPVDSQGRMQVQALPRITGPTIVCIQAGNVNTGAFDPAAEICRIAHAAGAWVHVDGAFGLWAAAAPARAHLAQGVSEADSWATDAHKWLNVSYDSGLVFCRNADHLRAAMSHIPAAYLEKSGQREPMEYTPEMSRRARGIEIWSALRSLGRAGLAEMIERCCRHAARFAEGLAAGGCEILNEVQLNQVLVSFGSPERTQQVIRAVQQDGTCWCGSTVWQGRTAMRISVSSWATTAEDVEESLAAILRVAASS